MAVNGNLETDFDIDESAKVLLSIQNSGIPNCEKVAAEQIGSTLFSAKLRHVQYGTYNGTAAVLLVFNSEFGFQSQSLKRITFVSIKLTFEETSGPDLKTPDPRNPNNDPIVVTIAPVQVCGSITTVQRTKKWNLTIPVQLQQFGIHAGPQIGYDDQEDHTTDHRMWSTGLSTSEDDHDADNTVSWEMQENSAQKVAFYIVFLESLSSPSQTIPSFMSRLVESFDLL